MGKNKKSWNSPSKIEFSTKPRMSVEKGGCNKDRQTNQQMLIIGNFAPTKTQIHPTGGFSPLPVSKISNPDKRQNGFHQ